MSLEGTSIKEEKHPWQKSTCSECGEPVWHQPAHREHRVLVCWKCAGEVELPKGCRHHNTTLFAESWTAYDELGYEDGWKEGTFYDARTGRPHSYKRGEIRGHEITVHQPRPERPRVCPDCHGEGKHNPSRDPQREVDCPTCRGDGEDLGSGLFTARHDSHLAI